MTGLEGFTTELEGFAMGLEGFTGREYNPSRKTTSF